MRHRTLIRIAQAALVCVVLGGCASANPRDPLERYNRAAFAFNDTVDRYAAKPVAEGYRKVVPSPVRTGVRNFFANLEDVWTGTNNLLQGKVGDALNDWMRVAINSVIGLGGLLDVASEARLEKHYEDFGQTLGWWGVPSGPYFVVPLLGPRTVRDTAALPLDLYGTRIGTVAGWAADRNEVALRNSLYALDYVRIRADALDATNLLEGASLDRYSFVRDAYLQRRLNQVYDGNPPKRKDDDDDAMAVPGTRFAHPGGPSPRSVVPLPGPRVDALASVPGSGSAGTPAENPATLAPVQPPSDGVSTAAVALERAFPRNQERDSQ